MRKINFVFRFSAWAVLLIFIGLTPLFAQSGYIKLDNGIDLSNWDVQGQGAWTVENGEIKGVKPPDQSDWGHLVSKQKFTDAYIQIKYNVMEGNSGLYIRSEIAGIYGVIGIQVELGGNDGWAMTVTENAYNWYEGRGVDSGFAQKGQWNEMAVQIEGQKFTSYVNGKKVLMQENIDTGLLPTEGKFSFQLHAGNSQNTLYLKDIEVFTPTKITGCADSNYVEYNSNVNDYDSSACQTMVSVHKRFKNKNIIPKIYSYLDFIDLLKNQNNFNLWDLKGQKIFLISIPKNMDQPAVVFIQFDNGIVNKILLVE